MKIRPVSIFLALTLALSIGFYFLVKNTYFLYTHYNGISFYYIATKLTGNEKNTLKKLEILLSYMKENVFCGGGFQVKDLPPLENLIRGLAWCDQASHLYLRLLEPLDIRGYLLFLNDKKDGTGSSPHSVAAITIGRKDMLDFPSITRHGVIVDGEQGVLFKNTSGESATFSDICDHDILESQRKYFIEGANWYDLYCNKARVFLSNTPISKDNLRRRIFYRLIFPLIPEKLIHIYQDMVMDKYHGETFIGDLDLAKEIDFRYFKARNYHIYGRFEEADELYSYVIENSSDDTMKSGCLFFKGMMGFSAGEFEKAEKDFKKITERYPGSAWAPLAGKWLQKIHDGNYISSSYLPPDRETM